MDNPLIFSPIATEWDKFVTTGMMGCFLLGGLPLAWESYRSDTHWTSWAMMGIGIIGFAGAAAFTCLSWFAPDGVVTYGFVSGLIVGGFSGYGLIVADYFDERQLKGRGNGDQQKPAKSSQILDAKTHNERIKFIANFYNTVAVALIVTAFITPVTNLVLMSTNFTLSWPIAIFIVLAVALAAGFHFWARTMLDRLMTEPK